MTGDFMATTAQVAMPIHAGAQQEAEILKLAAESGLNEKAFRETLQSSETASLASSLAAACRYSDPVLSECGAQ